MKEGYSINPGSYLHKYNENEPYYVLGLATRAVESIKGESFGTALWVEGFEKSGKVSGERIQIFRSPGGDYTFEPIDPFESPPEIVVYRQDYKGTYDPGQLWGRSIPDFLENFEPA